MTTVILSSCAGFWDEYGIELERKETKISRETISHVFRINPRFLKQKWSEETFSCPTLFRRPRLERQKQRELQNKSHLQRRSLRDSLH